MDLLLRIKRLIWQHRIAFTKKATDEMDRDGIDAADVAESILNAGFIRTKRSESRRRRTHREKVHIIEGFTYDGLFIYTKGVIRRVADQKIFVCEGDR